MNKKLTKGKSEILLSLGRQMFCKTTTNSKRREMMKSMFSVIFLVVAIAVLVTMVPLGASAIETDDNIESSAKNSYVFQEYLKDDAITIESKDGAVTLTGTVAEESHKSLAQDTVTNISGVKSVDNRLKFKGEHAAENSDAWITMKAKTVLLFHKNVSAMTEVSTKNGIVTLKGEADNKAQKDLTTEFVKDVEGVRDVQNEMTLSKAVMNKNENTMGQMMDTVGEKIDDASVTALVKMTLLYHRSTSALNTNVETDKGIVTLDGKAKNAAEKDLVTKYVQDVDGVESVVNNMTIENSKSAKN